ncbi:MAG: hypothetical protein H0X11_10965, partial [Betaproteobacteria bacterium]|nr:hypothetical protein [Betaproteobacteria bacterium]
MTDMTQHDGASDLPRELHAAHFEQYFGAWACQESFFRSAFDRVGRMDLRVHVERQRDVRADGGSEPSTPPPANYPVTESGVAVLQLSGVLMKHVGSLEEGTSTVMFRRKLRAATNNP